MMLWTPTDDPQTHPLWETQVELERGMLRAGADAFRDRVLVAERKGQLTRLGPYRGLISEWLPGIADAIKSWVRDVERSRGPTPIALPYVKLMDPHVAALVTIRAILNGTATMRTKLVGLALTIGRTCEYEQRVRHWEATEPDLFYHYKDEMDRNRATGVHRRRVNINRFNALLEDGTTALVWEDWPEEAHFRVGIALIETVIRKTGWFELAEDPDHVWRRGATHRPALVLLPKQGLTDWLVKAMEQAELRSPEYAPTVIPPKRWGQDEQSYSGGYWTPYVRTPKLVRFKASQATQRIHAAAEYDALDMPMVYDAIHMLQETAWKVNRRVLDVAEAVWSKSGEGGVAGLPQIGETELPSRTPRMVEHAAQIAEWKANRRRGPRPAPDAETDAEILAWKKRASPIHRFNAKRISKYMATSDTILLARKYQDFDAFYFPHMLDFRGRIYPIPSYLQPQGNDLSRGLLTFAEGLPITEENGGAGWLAVHLANVWGEDKVSFDERIAFVYAREDLWRAIAADPYASTEWQTADKPFQSLAAIFEWVGFLEQGWGYVSNLPVMVDGTCNGIQHLSAILRDEVSGRYVNLEPADRPQDIYKVVAVGNDAWSNGGPGAVEGLQRVLERIERAGGPEAAKATYWLDLCNRDLPRTLTKRQVMVLPYGGTKDSYFTYTREWLDEHDPVRPDPMLSEVVALAEARSIALVTPEGEAKDAETLAREVRTANVVFLAARLWDVVGTVVEKGLSVMDWLQKCAKVVAVANQPIYWEVPSGFVVRHFYGLDRSFKCEVMLDGERVQLRRTEKTSQLSTKEQVQGISPNFIHSLDASCLVECLRRCREAGIEEFSSVHDAYGTHAANMGALSVFLREAFVATHEVDVLGEFRSACQRVLVDYLVDKDGIDPLEASEKADAMLPQPLERGSLDLSQVLEADYFFA